MSTSAVLQYAAFLTIVTLLVRPVGGYLARVFSGQRTLIDPILRPVETGLYRLSGVDPAAEMTWREYAAAFIRFGLLGTLLLFLLLRLQPFLPWYFPASQTTPMTGDLALNTAVSFSTTTTWQAYAGEITMSYFSQMAGLTAQNFLAGAAGLAVGVAFIRGFARGGVEALGNFWADVVRALLWVLLPVAFVGGLILVLAGVPQNLAPYTPIETLAGVSVLLPQGPVASLELIKNLGTNGGGVFNANGAHPFENPSSWTNLLEMLAIVVIPAAFTYTFGRMTGHRRAGWTLYLIMLSLFLVGLVICGTIEQGGNPLLAAAGAESSSTINGIAAAGGNMEGKEVRFGVAGSVLTAITTSNGATGSYNAMHDSFLPLGGAVPLVNMLIGEVIFGGLGTGLFSLVFIALVGVFVTGLMIGRTPEYLGKRIGPPETRLIILAALVVPASVLLLAAVASVAPQGLAGLTTNDGAHGLTEILYAFATSVANNGQNMAGLSANSLFYNLTTAIAMLAGRFGLGVLALALAGSLAAQQVRSPSPGALRVDTPLFATVVIGAIILLGALTFLPVLSLGPVADHVELFVAR
jgi:K+-transporting ATPase ATPase A chain